MIITIIGSINSSKNEMERLAKIYKEEGYKVYAPILNNEKQYSLLDIQMEYLNLIDKADIVVVVRKPDGTLGESTTYELAYCVNILEKWFAMNKNWGRCRYLRIQHV
jgi:nucleoside 2-deoxyribosyltransferase